jgi:uncharacterized protein (TIGR03083 family)
MTVPAAVQPTIDKLDETWRSISELGATLTEAEWKLPTDNPSWTVQDNLSHMIGTERRLEGLSGTNHRAADTAHVRNEIGMANEHEVDSRRGETGARVLEEWNEIVERRLSTLRAGDEAYYTTPTITPTGPGTIADFLHIRVMDCWVHEQDMRRAVGKPGHLSGACAEHSVDRLIRTLPIVVGKRAAAPEGSTVVIDITGPVERTLPVTVTAGRAAIVPTVPDDVLTTVSMDSETFIVLATGRATSGERAGWTVSGDETIGLAVVSQLNMMI